MFVTFINLIVSDGATSSQANEYLEILSFTGEDRNNIPEITSKVTDLSRSHMLPVKEQMLMIMLKVSARNIVNKEWGGNPLNLMFRSTFIYLPEGPVEPPISFQRTW
jgi:hypothetical protein